MSKAYRMLGLLQHSVSTKKHLYITSQIPINVLFNTMETIFIKRYQTTRTASASHNEVHIE